MTPKFESLKKVVDLVPGYTPGKVLDPPFEHYEFQGKQKLGNRKNYESDAMSEVLGFVG